MECTEEGQPSKPERSSSSAMDHKSTHVYPDWAVMQAYYGPRFAVPPYVNSAIASPHGPPPYMWVPPQPMIPPYGAAFYAHGGIFGHTGVPTASTAFSMDTPVKSSGNTEGGFMKKLKEFDGLEMSMGNGNADNDKHRTDHRPLESEETEGSSDESNGIMAGAGKSSKNKSRHRSPNGGHGKAQKKCRSILDAKVGQGSATMIRPAKTPVKTSENSKSVSEPEDPSYRNIKPSPTKVPHPSMPHQAWLQNEQELKRERRKQSNRESARRSRLRKQVEAEELAASVRTLTSENLTLKSEMNKLMARSEKLRVENAVLMEKLKAALKEDTTNDLRLKPDGTKNLLERVNKNDSTDDGNSYDNRSPIGKLHQLLDASHITDAVAAG